MTEALATKEDVVKALGRDLTDSETKQVDVHLLKVSELFRKEARQQFTPGRSTNRLRVTAGALTLPQRPVAAVLTVNGEPADRFTLMGQRLEVPVPTGTTVVVDYEHGSDEVPDLVTRSCSRRTRAPAPASRSAGRPAGPSAPRRPTRHGRRAHPRASPPTTSAPRSRTG
jgi:hypothetical protein